MAHITFKKNQPIQSLSGTVGGLTFRTVNGRTFVSPRTEPVLPKNPTRKQRARFKQQTIINNCISILQSQYEDIQKAISMRAKIKSRLTYLYKKYVATIKAPTKLQKAIMTDYYAQFSATSPSQYRSKTDATSNHSRAKINRKS